MGALDGASSLTVRGAGVFADAVDHWRHSPRRAITVDDRQLTYAEWSSQGEALARSLVAFGVERPARVATLLPNGPELLIVLYACSRIGVTAVPMSTWATPSELAAVIETSSPDLVLASDAWPTSLATLASALAGLGGVRPPVYAWGSPKEPALPVAELFEFGAGCAQASWAEAKRAAQPDADLAILFTSGSTGKPKGVILQQGAVTRNGAAIASRMGFGLEERVYTYFPLFFSGGLCNALSGAVSVGAELVTQSRFLPDEAATLIRSRACTARHVWHDGLKKIAESDVFGSLEMGRMRRGLIVDYDLLRSFGLGEDDGVNMYGMTETATAFTCGDASDTADIRRGSHGRTLPGNELRIVDPGTGRLLPPGGEGEICVRGPNMMRGYTDGSHEQLTDESGFFHTGDVGVVDDGGLLRYLGRTKTLIKVKGLTIQPEEVEAVLLAHPGVRQVGVAGMGGGDESTGVAALVVLEGHVATDASELAAYCRAHLSSYKVPAITVVADDDFPRSASFKVDRVALRARLDGTPQ